MQLREREVFVTISWTLTHCVMMQQVDETPADSAFVTAMALLSVGAAKRCQSDKALSGQGTAGLPSLHRTSLPRPDGHAGRSPGAGGRPLRRRREMVLIYERQPARGTAGLQKPVVEAAKRQRPRRLVIFHGLRASTTSSAEVCLSVRTNGGLKADYCSYATERSSVCSIWDLSRSLPIKTSWLDLFSSFSHKRSQ
jgi:hypothetical protein